LQVTAFYKLHLVDLQAVSPWKGAEFRNPTNFFLVRSQV
jgi:hypothetical protein